MKNNFYRNRAMRRTTCENVAEKMNIPNFDEKELKVKKCMMLILLFLIFLLFCEKKRVNYPFVMRIKKKNLKFRKIRI